MINTELFVKNCWEAFVKNAPNISLIKQLLVNEKEKVVHDHIAFRLPGGKALSLKKVEPIILDLGYSFFDSYYFPDKGLRAISYNIKNYPKIFISELCLNQFSSKLKSKMESISNYFINDNTADILTAGKRWKLSIKEYYDLSEESEYAAWIYACGLIPNHFTINVNELKKYNSVEKALDFIEEKGFSVNYSGGRVKGSAAHLLKQGSTKADLIFCKELNLRVPSCYYEFAQRYIDNNGNLFDGFIEKSANKIFESTNVR